VSDLERAIARLHASTVAGAGGREAANVVLYEDGAKRKVRQLLGAMKDMQVGVGWGWGAGVEGG
jgi:DNA mismatch repair protein MSH6